MRDYYFIILIALGMPILQGAANAETKESSLPGVNSAAVLEVDGVKFSLVDFESRRPTALFQARNTFYETQRKALEEFVEEYLLEQQAKKESVTVTQLLERHVNNTIAKDPSDEVLRVYYEGVDTAEPFEAVRDRIVDALRQRRIAKARTAYVQSLRDQAKVAILLSPPRAQMSLKDTPVRGQTDAPLMLVEFADYECPFCQEIKPTLDKLLQEFPGKIALAFKDAPLPMHRNAQKAAEATRCAEAQGKYWEYHDLLFSRRQLDLTALKEHARGLGLDTKAFDQCLDSGAKADLVKASMSEATGLGLRGTPSFFLNGRQFSGALTLEKFRGIVAEEISSRTDLPRAARR
jgi:protein-disulfide isomerase